MHIQTSPKTEALAERYATLKAQAKSIDAQIKTVTAELKKNMKVGEAVTTQEYRLTFEPGKSYFTWLCSDEEKKSIQNHLIEKKVADMKVGEAAIVLRFIKGGTGDE